MGEFESHISVCVCTFKRPHLLKRLFESLRNQKTDGLFCFSIVVVDNDREESAKETVMAFAQTSGIEITYWMEPVPSFAVARNKVVRQAQGTHLAFIDDDEFPKEDWLLRMFTTCETYNVEGVLGPVLPHFDTPPPTWLTKAGFYNRPRHATGFIMNWQEARTGNVLIRRDIVNGLDPVFRFEFSAGGEDQDFFRRMMEKGHKFIWCDEAPAYETVPPHRWQRRFLIKRAFLRGNAILKHPKDRLRNIAKSLVATPVYALVLPFLLILGQHHFMKYFVRFCDHAGRLLALVNLNPVRDRNN